MEVYKIHSFISTFSGAKCGDFYQNMRVVQIKAPSVPIVHVFVIEKDESNIISVLEGRMSLKATSVIERG